jgi:hypothetical protein
LALLFQTSNLDLGLSGSGKISSADHEFANYKNFQLLLGDGVATLIQKTIRSFKLLKVIILCLQFMSYPLVLIYLAELAILSCFVLFCLRKISVAFVFNLLNKIFYIYGAMPRITLLPSFSKILTELKFSKKTLYNYCAVLV